MSSFDYVGPPVLSTSNGQASALVIGSVEVASSDNDLEVNFTYSSSSGSTFAYLAFHNESDAPVYQFGFGFDSAAVGTTGDMGSYVSNISQPTAGSYTIKLYILLPYYPGTAYVNELHVAATTVPPPPNDDFADAIEINGNGTSSATTAGGTIETGEPSHEFSGEPTSGREGSIWYRWQPTAKDQIFYVLVGSDSTSPLVSAYEGTALDNLVRVSNSDNIIWPEGGPGWEHVMINGELGKTYYIAIEAWGDVEVQWITEQAPPYHFDSGRSTLLISADFGPEGFLFPDKEDYPYTENYGYSNALLYGQYAVYDDFPPLGDVFEGEHYFWFPTVIDQILYTPWRDLGAFYHGTDVIDHDPSPKVQIWVYEHGLLEPPIKDRFDDALDTVARLYLGGYQSFASWRNPERLIDGAGHLFLCWTDVLAKFTLEGDLVAVAQSPNLMTTGTSGGEFSSACMKVNDTEMISPPPNDFGGLSDPSYLWNLDTLEYDTIALTGGDLQFPMLMPEGRILSTNGGGFAPHPIELTLYDNTWRDSVDVLDTWSVNFPDPQNFDHWNSGTPCVGMDGHTVYLTRFWEAYDGHRREQYSSNLGGNWIILTIYAFDLDTSELTEIGRYDYWPRWSDIGFGPNWYFPQWLLDAHIKLRPEFIIGDLTARARPMGVPR